MYSPTKKIAVAMILFLSILPSAYSADIARSLRNNTLTNSEPDNFFEIGIGAQTWVGSTVSDIDGKYSGVAANLSGSYNWKGFFIDIDIFSETDDPKIIGYNAYNSDTWSFDVTLSNTGDGISEDTDYRFTGLSKRDSSSMLGGRLTGYFGQNVLQFSLKHDVNGRSKGTVASALMGRNWQYRNWNFHGLAGLNYRDAKYNDYYLGVTSEESIKTGLAAYDGETSLTFNSSIGVTYPLSESWVFRATAYFGSNFGQNDSPLFKKRRNFHTGLTFSISYVF